MKRKLLFVLISGALASGCGDIPKPSDRPLENWESGALIGAGIGAVVGAVAYSKDRTKGAVLAAKPVITAPCAPRPALRTSSTGKPA